MEESPRENLPLEVDRGAADTTPPIRVDDALKEKDGRRHRMPFRQICNLGTWVADQVFGDTHPDTVARWGLILEFTLFVIAIGSIIFGMFRISSQVTTVGNQLERVERDIASSGFTINSPQNSTDVVLTEIIRGWTPFPELNHYIVVTPENGVDYVQDSDVNVSRAGTWTGTATFGSRTVGVGERYLIRGLATESELTPGQLREVPHDAVYSEPVMVRRVR